MVWANRLCRICTRIGRVSYYIFENESGRNIELKMKTCLSFPSLNDDHKPKEICDCCYEKLDEFYRFIELYRSSNFKFETTMYTNQDIWLEKQVRGFPGCDIGGVIVNGTKGAVGEKNVCVNYCEPLPLGVNIENITLDNFSSNYQSSPAINKGNLNCFNAEPATNITKQKTYSDFQQAFSNQTVLRHSSEFYKSADIPEIAFDSLSKRQESVINNDCLSSNYYSGGHMLSKRKDCEKIDNFGNIEDVYCETVCKQANVEVKPNHVQNFIDISLNEGKTNEPLMTLESGGYKNQHKFEKCIVNTHTTLTSSVTFDTHLKNDFSVDHSNQTSANLGHLKNPIRFRTNENKLQKDLKNNSVPSDSVTVFDDPVIYDVNIHGGKMESSFYKENDVNVRTVYEELAPNVLSTVRLQNKAMNCQIYNCDNNPSDKNSEEVNFTLKLNMKNIARINVQLTEDICKTSVPETEINFPPEQNVNEQQEMKTKPQEHIQIQATHKESITKTKVPCENEKTVEIKNNGKSCGNTLICNECKKPFAKRIYLKAHMALHTNIRPFVCDKCPKKFATRRDLHKHQRLHSGLFQCEYCSKNFGAPSKLERHHRTHTKLKPFLCSVDNCGKWFSDKGNLEGHKLSHFSTRDFVCAICTKAYKTNSQLTDHQKVHSDSSPFQCDVCSKTYKWKTNLNLHMKKHKGYKCDRCEKDCGKLLGLLKHRKVCPERITGS